MNNQEQKVVNVSDIDSQEEHDQFNIDEKENEIDRLKSLIKRFISTDKPDQMNQLKKEAAEMIKEEKLYKPMGAAQTSIPKLDMNKLAIGDTTKQHSHRRI